MSRASLLAVIAVAACGNRSSAPAAVAADAALAAAPATGPHPLIGDEPGSWKVKTEPTANGESVLLEGPLEGNVRLRVHASFSTYPSDQDAIRALDKILADADPDTGISYAWDVVERRGPKLVHLSGGCVWSGRRWRGFNRRLDAWLGPPDQAIDCTCGAGCRRL